MKFLEDKVAIITGGARGIGKQIASKFLEHKAKPIVWDVDQEALSDIKNEFKDDIQVVSVDITNPGKVQEAVDKILDNFTNIDILVNNAGITRDSLLMRMKDEDWDMVLNVNLKGAFVCTKIVSKVMMKQRSGKIINISSIVGLMGNPGQVNYSASKAGMLGLTKSSARELALRGINVNAIAPGFIETKMTEALPQAVKDKMLSQISMGKLGAAEDVANAALFLGSSLSGYITGQVIVVDGGLYM